MRVTRNQNLAKGFANGATGVVKELNRKEGRLVSISVKLDPSQNMLRIGWTSPVCDFLLGTRVKHQTMPLTLNYSGTIHVSQGNTYADKVFVDMRPFSDRQGYTAISRNTAPEEQLKLARLPTPEDLRVISFPTPAELLEM